MVVKNNMVEIVENGNECIKKEYRNGKLFCTTVSYKLNLGSSWIPISTFPAYEKWVLEKWYKN